MLLFAIALFIAVADQLSKAYIKHTMQVGDSVAVVPGVFHITHVQNTGAAFGLLQNQKFMFLTASLVIIVSIVYYYWRTRPEARLTTVALACVLGGAIGNLIDRAIAGRVTDFIDFRVWPVFNVADSSIVIGVLVLSIVLLRSAHEEGVETQRSAQ